MEGNRFSLLQGDGGFVAIGDAQKLMVAFNDRDYSTTELAEESGTNESELLGALEELLAHGYVRYQNNAYILQEVK